MFFLKIIFQTQTRILTEIICHNAILQCCAISFIENLTHESLQMPQDEFDSLMAGDRAFSSAWESALMACESLHMISENMRTMATLAKTTDSMEAEMAAIQRDLLEFKVSLKIVTEFLLI